MSRSTREEWSARIARWKSSGLRAAEFASGVGVRAGTLSWWKWRLGSEARSASAKRALGRRRMVPITGGTTSVSPLTFVEMTNAIESNPLEVVLTSSVLVRVRPGFDSATLGRLLDVLEARR